MVSFVILNLNKYKSSTTLIDVLLSSTIMHQFKQIMEVCVEKDAVID